MNKITILLSTVLTSVALTAGAQTNSFISSSQIKEYQENLNYLDCVYSSATNCDSNKDVLSARAIVVKLKDMPAQGLNKSKKNSFDAQAQSLLLNISIEEAKAYIESFDRSANFDVTTEMANGATMYSYFKMPGDDTLANAERGIYSGEGMNDDSVVHEETYTVDQLRELQAENKDDSTNQYSERQDNLKGAEFSRTVSSNGTYLSKDNFKTVIYEYNKESAQNGLSMQQNENHKITLKRYYEHDYDIKIAHLEVRIVSAVKEGIHKKENSTITHKKITDSVTDYKVDDVWNNRYKDIIEADRVEAEKVGNYMVLEYAVASIKKTKEEIKSETDESKKNELRNKVKKAFDDSSKYYDALAPYSTEEDVRALMYEYNSLKGY